MRHPLRALAASRTRLAVTALLATGALVAASLWLDWFMSSQSRSTGHNTLAILLWLFGVLVVGGVDALLLGDVLLPEGWREHLLHTKGARRSSRRDEREADDDLDPRRYRSYTIHFSFLLGLAVVGNLLLAGEMGSGALWRIQEVQLSTGLRAEQPAARLRSLAFVPRLDTEDMLPAFTMKAAELLDDPDGEVAGAALDVVGHVAARMRRAMAALRAAREPQRWEKALFERLQQTQSVRVAARFRHDDRLRGRAALALGALQALDELQAFESFLWQDEPDRETVVAIAVATGDMQDLRALPVPLALLQRGDEEAQAHASWALGEILGAYTPDSYTREPLCVTEAMEVIGAQLGAMSLLGRCALVEALARVRDARMATSLFALFDATGEDLDCPRREFVRAHGRPSVISAGGPLKIKVLEAVATIAGGNEEVLEWLTRRLGRGDLSPRYERELSHVIDLVRRSMER